MKLVVYMAVFGGYDVIRSPRRRVPGVDYICFTEGPEQVPAGWAYRGLPAETSALSPASRSRWAKMHADRLFPSHDVSVYVDGNISVIGDVAELARTAAAVGALSMYDHPFRTCLYDEAVVCARAGLVGLGPIRRQVERYAAEGFPRQVGLYEANVMVRRHHDPHVVRTMERWWSEWQNAAIQRDQLSLTYALWREGLAVNSLGRHDPRFVQTYFSYQPHQRPWRGRPKRLARRCLNRIRLCLAGGLLPVTKAPAPQT